MSNRFLQYFDDGGDVLPPQFKEAYDELKPNPDAQYGTGPLGFYAQNKPGSPSWVTEGTNTRLSIPDWLRRTLTGMVDNAAGTQTGEVTMRGLGALSDAGSLASAPAGALAANTGPGKLQFIKNLLTDYGTTAEQRAVNDVRQHAINTGNEKIIVGGRYGMDTLENLGGPTSVKWPVGFKEYKQQMGEQGREVFSAHPHPVGTPSPSKADLDTWMNDHYVPALKKQGVYIPEDKYARDQMWITGIKGPQDTLMMPSMRQESYPETFLTRQHVANIDKTFNNALNTPKLTPEASDLYHAFKTFTRPTMGLDRNKTDPETYNQIYDSLSQAMRLEQLSKHTPILQDADTLLAKDQPNLKMGDVIPEWLRYVGAIGNPIYKAKGGRIAAIKDALRSVGGTQ